MSTEDDALNQWHLDKRVPISIILAMLGQFAGGLWFVARLEARVVALEAAQVAQDERDHEQDRLNNQNFNLLRSDLRDVIIRLDRLIERERVK